MSQQRRPALRPITDFETPGPFSVVGGASHEVITGHRSGGINTYAFYRGASVVKRQRSSTQDFARSDKKARLQTPGTAGGPQATPMLLNDRSGGEIEGQAF